jgi:prophage tail gpP-like protein
MVKPVYIFINGAELTGYTDMRLKRSKDQFTGDLSFSVFMGYMPTAPVLASVTRGAEVIVYIGGQIAFYGTLDRRKDSGTRKGKPGTTRSEEPVASDLTVGPNEYTVRFSARGKAKTLVDSSHQHPTTNELQTTNQKLIQKLVEPFGVELDWQAEEKDIKRWRLRDGGRVMDEIQRLCEQFSLYVHETADGKLRIQDKAGTSSGEPIMLGRNILSFSSEQSADMERQEVQVKGQLIDKDKWGDEAVIPTVKKVKDGSVPGVSPITVQLYGDAPDDLIEKRAEYEANKRASQAKRVSVEVFHVQQSGGAPWDIGEQHFVSIPPVGVSMMMEIVDLEYVVDADKTLMTNITLAPPPVSGTGSVTPSAALGLSALPEFLADAQSVVNTAIPAALLASWAGPSLTAVSLIPTVANVVVDVLDSIVTATKLRPPAKLPAGFKGTNE